MGSLATTERTRPAPAAVDDPSAAEGLLAACEARMIASIAETGPGPEAAVAARTIRAGGKRLRPRLLVACAGPAPSSPERVIHAAAAVELLHTATLVHDDVIDGATARRGEPTVVHLHGPGAAARVGDLLLARAFAELARTGSAEAVGVLARAAVELTRGEAGQLASAHDLDVGEREYFARCRRKTASLFVAACRIGALLGGADRGVADELASVAERLGVAFQILDDVLDLAAPAEATGKSRGADLRDGTMTLPLILALRLEPGLRGRLARAREEQDLTALCDRLADHPGTLLAREEGRRQLRVARRALDRLPPDVETGSLRRALEGLDARLAAPAPAARAA